MHLSDENFTEFVSNWPRFKDRVVIFLGAGASVGAVNIRGVGLPNAYELRNDLWRNFKADGGAFEPGELKLMSLEHAAAIIENKVGRDELAKYLSQAFACDRPLWQHAVLPFLRPRSLFTTNYDELVELGYKLHPTIPFDVISRGRKPVLGRTVLYKPHGTLTHANQPTGSGGLVITQFDYFEMIAEYRQMLRDAMTGFDAACVLIAGYSFGDMDIGAELFSLRKQNQGIPWYTIFPRNDPQVRKMYSRRFAIEQINATLEDFLRALDVSVGFIPDERMKFGRKGDLKNAAIIQ
jgi:hypothetical protein